MARNNNLGIIPYHDYSRGARNLAQALNGKRYRRLEWSRLASELEVVINWGSFKIPAAKRVLNEPKAVTVCSDKLKFFDTVKDTVRIPEYTNNLETALKWVEEGKTMMGRTRRGSSGEGIVFYEDDYEKFLTSEFWVAYKRKKDEYRVHIAFGEVIDFQRKAVRKTDLEGNTIDTKDVDFRVRNLDNGFVFIRGGVNPPADVLEQARLAVSAVGLDFGAVDVIYNQTEDKGYVLEVNTAPGLEGATVESYAAAIKKALAA